MKFLADVNIPFPLIEFLRKNNHEIQYATKEFPQEKDVNLIKAAQDNGQIILTRDKDFLELTRYPKYKTPLILISLTNQQTNNIIAHFKDFLENQSEDVVLNSVTIIREDRADSFPLS